MLLKERNGNENNKNWIVIGMAMTRATMTKIIHFLRFFSSNSSDKDLTYIGKLRIAYAKTVM